MTNEALGNDRRLQVQDMRRQGMSVADISAKTGLAKPTVYAYARLADKKPRASNGSAAKASGGTLSIVAQPDGTFLVKVPAEKLTAVARALS